MKLFFYSLLIFITLSTYGSDKKVLIEMLTNSHCGVCPGAHNTIKNYLNTSGNADRINMIFYHMTFPYSDDQLSQANTADPAGRNSYYGPFSSTPVAFFNGKVQVNNYSNWAANINQQLAETSPLDIILTGTKENNSFSINAQITRTGNIIQTDLVIHFVVVENVTYVGRNGVSPQNFVMRKMITTPTGESFNISSGETKNVSKNINLESGWIPDSLSVVVFVQSSGSKDIFQSEMISYKNLIVTNIENETQTPKQFSLKQNYPNPFNPVTEIRYQIAEDRKVSLIVYDILGNEVVTLVNEEQSAGSYKVNFSTGSFGIVNRLSSGIYYYKLSAGSFVETKKMIILK
jgi:hypothetical protein